MRYKISIIVPIYNVEKYLVKCIDSLCKNKHKEIEIILVDDGSKDESSRIVDGYQDVKGISIIHKENGGISSARNAGLKVAKGEYVTFIDSDDWVTDLFCEKVLPLLNDKPEIVVFGYYNYNEIKKCENSIDLTSQQLIMQANEAVLFLDSKGYLFNLAWNKIYKKSIIDSIWFEEGTSYCEDLLFNVEVFKRIHFVKFSTEKYYVYRTTANSLTNNKYYDNYYNIAMKAINARRDLYNYYHLHENISLLELKENEYLVGVVLNIYKKEDPFVLSKRVEMIKSVSGKIYKRKTNNRKMDLVIIFRNHPRILDVILKSLFYMKRKIRRR